MSIDADRFCADLESDIAAFMHKRSTGYLRDVASSGCFIYGAGGFGRRVLALLRDRNIACLGIIDKKFNGTGAVFDGVPALHPQMLQSADAAGRGLVIGVHNHLADLAEILAFGRSHPFRDVLLNADLPDLLGPGANNYWLGDRRFIVENFAHIRTAARRLADETSVVTLAALIRYRITGDVSAHPPYDLGEQYLPPGLLNFRQPITFVDGGAYNGDTYGHLLSKGIKIDHWIGFEPDPQNFEALAAAARSQPGRATLFPCGLGDHFMHVPFAANQGTSSHLGNLPGAAEMTVPCVALDDVIHGAAPDYIKLDIEGAERDALLGMRNTIAACRPALAVSAYHRPEDLWAIPQTLGDLAPYTKLYLRQHAANAFDTVAYAVPG
jgi:FkbM family methyltransferase